MFNLVNVVVDGVVDVVVDGVVINHLIS